MVKKINYWKVSAFCMFAIIILLAAQIISDLKTYDLGMFSISEKTLNGISETVEQPFKLCEIETNKCVVVGKLPS